MPEVEKHKFTIYHLQYKQKLGIAESIKKLVINSTASTFAHNGDA